MRRRIVVLAGVKRRLLPLWDTDQRDCSSPPMCSRRNILCGMCAALGERRMLLFSLVVNDNFA